MTAPSVEDVMRKVSSRGPSIRCVGASEDTIQLSTTEPMVEPTKPPMVAAPTPRIAPPIEPPMAAPAAPRIRVAILSCTSGKGISAPRRIELVGSGQGVRLPACLQTSHCRCICLCICICEQEATMPDPQPTSETREARLFRNNKSQAVRIPADFEMPGDRVTICRDGDRLIIEPVRRKNLLEVLAGLEPLGPEDQFPEIDETLLPARDIDL
jgi:antitoxin VapB